MNTAAPDAVPGDPLEDLVVDAIAALETGGPTALESILAAHPEHAATLRAALSELQRAELLHTPVPPSAPQRLGEFQIEATLGSGGMGVVYLARQTTLDRHVALKVVRPELLLFPGSRERFQREIDAVARLEHPAIVPILATGQTDGVPWYTMPRLPGRTAEDVVRALGERTPADLTGADLRQALLDGQVGGTDTSGTFQGTFWQAAVRLVRQAAAGIQHAHERGVLHRDLKPGNLMLTADGRAMVLDFGLAQARGDARLTRTGSAAGSPAYMAPEQVRAEPADERTDVYGLGATLHGLLGLRPPFQLGDGDLVRNRILRGDRQPLRGRSDAPADLLLVLDTAMEVDRQRRYATAEAFAVDLQAVLDGRTIAARPLPRRVRLRRFVQRHRTAAAVAAVTLLFALLVPILLLQQQRRANLDLRAQLSRADRATAVSIDTVETLLGNLAVEKLRNVPAVQAMAADQMTAAVARLDLLADDPTHGEHVRELRQRSLHELISLETQLGRFEAARASTDRLIALLEAAPPSPTRDLRRGQARMNVAWLAFRNGDFAAATEALAAARRDLPADHSVAVAKALARAAELDAGLAEARNDADALLAASRERVDVLERALGADADDLDLWIARVALAAQLRTRRAHAESLQLLEPTIVALTSGRLPEAGWPSPRWLLAKAQHQIASIAHDQKDGARALAVGRDALGTLDQLVRDYPDDQSVRRQRGNTANLVAVVLHQEKRWKDARPLLEQACRDQEFVLSRTPGDRNANRFLASHRQSLSVCLRELEDWPALADVARAMGSMPGMEQLAGRAARDLLRCALADPGRRQALCDEALPLLERAVAEGLRLTPTDPLYDPVRDDPRFRALLPAGGR